VSKESRRRQRQTGHVPASGPTANRPTGPSAPAGPASQSTGPRGTERAGRRDRARPAARASFFQRYRNIILGAAIVAVVALVGAGVISSATQEAYACSNIWEPAATASPAAGASPQPGYVQPDMGKSHVSGGTKITYTYCPPASGRHFQQPAGPIPARLYGPNDTVIPQQWVHNLEHGALVILYRDAEADQAPLRALFDGMPPSPVCGFEPGGQSPGPVIGRFKDMAWPYAALVWGRVLPLQTLDAPAILEFYATFGEKTNGEKQCADPSAAPSAAPSGSAAPSTGASPSAAPSTPTSAAPSQSVAPSASPS
jgi:hypothetical protein